MKAFFLIKDGAMDSDDNTPGHGCMARGGHGNLKVSPGPAMPYLSTPCGQAILETALWPFQGWSTRRASRLWLSSTPLDTPHCTSMPMVPLTLMTTYGHPQGLLETVILDQKMAENHQNLKSRVKDLFLCKHVLWGLTISFRKSHDWYTLAYPHEPM